MSTAAERNDERFLKHLVESEPVRWKIAQFLSEKGHTVVIPPGPQPRKFSERGLYRDDGDLHVMQRVEVKQRSFVFSSKDDYRYKDFMICAKHSFDLAKPPKPFVFVILSSCGEWAGVVFASDSDKWRSERKEDPRYEDVSQDCYFSPLELVYFLKLK